MYYKLTKTFLEGRTKEDLRDMFGHLDIHTKKNKTAIVNTILNSFAKSAPHHMQPWGILCCFCRKEIYFAGSDTPLYCPRCGRTSPKVAHETQLKRATQLVLLASQNRKIFKEE